MEQAWRFEPGMLREAEFLTQVEGTREGPWGQELLALVLHQLRGARSSSDGEGVSLMVCQQEGVAVGLVLAGGHGPTLPCTQSSHNLLLLLVHYCRCVGSSC